LPAGCAGASRAVRPAEFARRRSARRSTAKEGALTRIPGSDRYRGRACSGHDLRYRAAVSDVVEPVSETRPQLHEQAFRYFGDDSLCGLDNLGRRHQA
jgi:hypothetical protein